MKKYVLKALRLMVFLGLCAAVLACAGEKAALIEAGQGGPGENGVFNPADFDKTVAPGDDFYRFVNGGWKAAHPLKPDQLTYNAFSTLEDKAREDVRAIVTRLAGQNNPPGTEAQKIAGLYNLYMDAARLNAEGAGPVKAGLERIAALDDKRKLTDLIAWGNRQEINLFFRFGIDPDEKNSRRYLFGIGQGGYGMNRDYYLDTDPRAEAIRAAYTEMAKTFFILAGYPAGDAQKAASRALGIETRLAKASRSPVEMRDPEALYHLVTVEDLRRIAPAIDWPAWFAALGLPGLQEINLAEPEYLEEVQRLLTDTPLEDLKSYLSFRLLAGASSLLSDEFFNAAFQFSKVLSGVEEPPERWKRGIRLVENALPDATGRLYAEEHFPPEYKERILLLVKNLQSVLADRIRSSPWMGDETKTAALEKLAAMSIRIGYPDSWRDYSGLSIDPDKSLWENIAGVSAWDWDYAAARYYEPVEEEWDITPQTVNAFYSPTNNSINFPAAILQPPFFYPDGDDAVNYGAIGVIIGHEITHGFDDQGRQFDKDGNLREWWTQEDTERFNAQAEKLAAYFDTLEVFPGVTINGKLTLGENIADRGGLSIAWEAWQRTLDGKTPAPLENWTAEQRFFLSFAKVWESNMRESLQLDLLKRNPHSPAAWRVNGTLPHLEEWYRAFGVSAADKLYIPPEKRIPSIW